MAIFVVAVKSDPALLDQLESIEARLEHIEMELSHSNVHLSHIADALAIIAQAFTEQPRIPTSIEFTAGVPQEESNAG
jgi:hypothetical protein